METHHLSLGLASHQRFTSDQTNNRERGGTNGNFTRKKNEIIKEYARHEGDTGSPEVQIAVLTEDINQLNEHARTHKKITILTVV